VIDMVDKLDLIPNMIFTPSKCHEQINPMFFDRDLTYTRTKEARDECYLCSLHKICQAINKLEDKCGGL
jgi:hypothetical protein